jgi:predicted RNase H-like HicB family nuclease
MVLIVFCSVLPNRATGQEILSLIQYTENVELQYWWISPEIPDLSPLDRLLSSGEENPFINVLESNSRSQISQIYREPDLSDTNARNLATLYDAEMILMGRGEIASPSPAAKGLFWVVDCSLESRLLSVAMDIVHQEINLSVIVRGDTPGEAVEEARHSLHSALLQRIEEVVQLHWTGAGEMEELIPSVVIQSPTTYVAVDAFVHDLRSYDETIDEVVEGWSTAGRIAFNLQLVEGAVWEDVSAILAEIAGQPGIDYRLQIGEISDLTVFLELAPVDVDEE